MKKTIILSLLLSFPLIHIFAIGVSDIPSIFSTSQLLLKDARALYVFSARLLVLNQSGFVVTIDGSTQTITLTTQQKLDLIGEYQAIKQNMQDHFGLLP